MSECSLPAAKLDGKTTTYRIVLVNSIEKVICPRCSNIYDMGHREGFGVGANHVMTQFERYFHGEGDDSFNGSVQRILDEEGLKVIKK